MLKKRRILHEVNALESSLNVLEQASKAISGPVDHAEYLRLEVPMAVEDAEAALKALRAIAADIEEAA